MTRRCKDLPSVSGPTEGRQYDKTGRKLQTFKLDKELNLDTLRVQNRVFTFGAKIEICNPMKRRQNVTWPRALSLTCVYFLELSVLCLSPFDRLTISQLSIKVAVDSCLTIDRVFFVLYIIIIIILINVVRFLSFVGETLLL